MKPWPPRPPRPGPLLLVKAITTVQNVDAGIKRKIMA